MDEFLAEGDSVAVYTGGLLKGTENPIGDAHSHPSSNSFAVTYSGRTWSGDLRYHRTMTSRYAQDPESEYTSYVYRRFGQGFGAADSLTGRLVPNPNYRPLAATHVIDQHLVSEVFHFVY